MNVEALAVDYFNGVGALEAFMDVPEDRPAEFLTVERVGGPEGRVLGSPMFAVQVWAEVRWRAAELADGVAVLARGMEVLPWVGRASVSSVVNFPDPDSDSPRYQITVELVTLLG